MFYKRLGMVALSLAAAVCLLFTGCSTPAVALTVGDKIYETGDYFAYVYNTLTNDSTAYLYAYYYGKDGLDEKVSYGEGDAATDVTVEEYIRRVAVDSMIRQVALEKLLAEHNLSWDKELQAEAEKSLAEIKAGNFLSYGFTNERYAAMYKAVALNEPSLFIGLYDKGGEREVPETEIREYFDNNYRSFFALDVSLVNEDKSQKSDEEIATIQKRLEEALAAFNKSGKTVDDFQKAYRQYLTAAGEKSVDDDNKPLTLSRQDVVKADTGVDEDLLKAVDAVAEGAAGIQTYQKGGTQKTMSLIFRLDPEAARDKDVDYYAQTRQRTLQYMKYEEFDKEVRERADALAASAVRNEKALKSVDIAGMLP